MDLAVVDEDDAVGHLAGKAHFVGDHQHGDAGVGQLLHQFQNLGFETTLSDSNGVLSDFDFGISGYSVDKNGKDVYKRQR